MNRRNFLGAGLLLGMATVTARNVSAVESAGMDALTALKTRHSVRSYTDDAVSEEQIKSLLESAMSAPSAGAEAPWEFVVIRDKATLAKVGGINQFAGYASKAPLAILTCLNTDYEKHKGMGIQDVSAATQNMLLAAHALGLGAVWTGIYPVEERIRGFQQLLGLPKNVQPVALVVIGHPKQAQTNRPSRYDPARVHMEHWENTSH